MKPITRIGQPAAARHLLVAWEHGDPQNFEAFVSHWRIAAALLLDHDELAHRVLSRLTLRIQRDQIRQVSDELLEDLLRVVSLEMIEDDLERARRLQQDPTLAPQVRANEFPCRELALAPEHCIAARARFNTLPLAVRKAFFALLHPDEVDSSTRGESTLGAPLEKALILQAFEALFDRENPKS